MDRQTRAPAEAPVEATPATPASPSAEITTDSTGNNVITEHSDDASSASSEDHLITPVNSGGSIATPVSEPAPAVPAAPVETAPSSAPGNAPITTPSSN